VVYIPENVRLNLEKARCREKREKNGVVNALDY
jgi:hypothetical protein